MAELRKHSREIRHEAYPHIAVEIAAFFKQQENLLSFDFGDTPRKDTVNALGQIIHVATQKDIGDTTDEAWLLLNDIDLHAQHPDQQLRAHTMMANRAARRLVTAPDVLLPSTGRAQVIDGFRRDLLRCEQKKFQAEHGLMPTTYYAAGITLRSFLLGDVQQQIVNQTANKQSMLHAIGAMRHTKLITALESWQLTHRLGV